MNEINTMDLIEINFKHINRHPWELARKAIVIELISKYISAQNRRIDVLDVGSGDAFLANSFTKLQNIEYTHCVDHKYTLDLKRKINSIYNNQNLKLYTNLNEIKNSKINFITLLDVIEHVPNDDTFLNNILKQPYINDNTYVLISVPAYQTLFSHHDNLLKHFRRYNLKKLKNTINKNNLEFIEGGYFFTSLLIPRFINMIFEKIKNKKGNHLQKVGNWKGRKTTTQVIKHILLFDYQIGKILRKVKINIPGLSCYVICRKSTIKKTI